MFHAPTVSVLWITLELLVSIEVIIIRNARCPDGVTYLSGVTFLEVTIVILVRLGCCLNLILLPLRVRVIPVPLRILSRQKI